MHLFLCLYYQVVSHMEYHRRVDALNSEDLRSLCKRLQVPLHALPGSAAVCIPTTSLRLQALGCLLELMLHNDPDRFICPNSPRD